MTPPIRDPESGPADLPSAVRTLQIIVPALASAVLIFGGVAVFLRNGGGFKGIAAETPIVTFALLGAAAMVGVVGRMVVVGAVENSGLKAIPQAKDAAGKDTFDSAALARLYTTRTIVAAALTEGPGLMCVVAYLLEGQPFALAGAAGAVAALLVQFPTLPAAESWAEDARRRLELDRR
jgi:hypothetical protein